MFKASPFCVLALVAALALPSLSGHADTLPTNFATQDTTDNQLQLRQLHLDHVSQVTTEGLIHQSINCWQITHGTWNGQTLDGLSLVLVKQQSDTNGVPSTDRCIYVSDNATPAQRDALVAAVVASSPSLFPDIKSIRIEPGAIEIENLDGTTLVLHLARIA